MPTVAHILKQKPTQQVYTIAPDATVFSALRLMAEKGIGALVVTQDNQVVGIISERDYARKIALMQRASDSTTVGDIMTHTVLTVRLKDSSKHCMQLMTDKHLRHLPVVENNELLGLISIGDLVKTLMEEQQKMIEQLQQYISG